MLSLSLSFFLSFFLARTPPPLAEYSMWPIKAEYLSTFDAKLLTELLERQLDAHEQYSRRPNLRIQGIPEDGRGEDVELKVLFVVNEKMGFYPPLRPTDIERSHRLGRAVSGQERPRAVIVRFGSERVRDSVYRARGSLKGHNDGKQQHARIFINEDLTARRATIAFKARELKKQRTIQDCWTHSGRILVKDNDNNIHEISSYIDLKRFTNV